jgi:hypothetical protein
MIHLGAPRMNGVPQHMSFIQNLLLLSFLLGYNQSFLEPQGSFHILVETSDLRVTFLHSSFDMTHDFIILLSGYDLIPQYGYEGDVVQ